VLAKYKHLEDIPEHHWRWEVAVRGPARLAAALNEQRDLALLFRDLATLRREAPVLAQVEDLRWQGPAGGLGDMIKRLRAWRFDERLAKLARR
jgi:hypothetical protein